ncbi:MAG: sugar ABC transporter permease [Oscillospiraceae bacterium]|nr:sugar ABC transporter permease [Oscillospiraceae bacterium]
MYALTRRTRSRIESVLYALPILLIFVFAVAIPLVQCFLYSLTDWKSINLEKNFVGLLNYVRVFQDSVFLKAAKNTLIVTFFVSFLQNAFSLFLATILNQKFFRGREIARSIIFIPTLIATMVLGSMWRLLLSPVRGPFAMLLKALEVTNRGDFNVLAKESTALYAIIFIMVWQYVGYNMLIYTAGLNSVPEELYESAKIDGAGPIAMFFRVTLPLIMPSITTNMFLNVIGCLKCFEYVYIVTSGGPNHATETLATYMYNTAFGQGQYGYGSAISCVLFVVVAIVGIVQTKVLRSREVEM